VKSGAPYRHGLCELFNDVINFTNELIKTKDPIVDDLIKEFPNLPNNLQYERDKIVNEIVPIMVLGMFSLLMAMVNRFLHILFLFPFIFSKNDLLSKP